MKKSIIALCITLLAQSTAFATDLHDWAISDYESASRSGLITTNVSKNNFSDNISRGEFCDLLVNLYMSVSGTYDLYIPQTTPFTDCNINSVSQCYALGIVSGRGDGTFDPEGDITRQEMAKLIVNTLKAAERNLIVLQDEAERLLAKYTDSGKIYEWAKNDMAIAIKYSIMSGTSKTELSPEKGATREQAVAVVNRVNTKYSVLNESYRVPNFTFLRPGMQADEDVNFSITPIDNAQKYILIIKDSEYNIVDIVESIVPYLNYSPKKLEAGKQYTALAGVRYFSGKEAFSVPVDFGYKQQAKPVTVVTTDIIPPQTTNTVINIPVNITTNNVVAGSKEMRVFLNGIPFQSAEEAAANMTEITVDVWNVGADGQKYAAKKKLTVNKNLADDVWSIFKEIFDHPSQFPIKSVGGYSWRTTAFGKVSQHSYGTCIDINPTENYYCYSDGTAITGTHWKPYEDIYSITPDGVVVATFAKYGWVWGGSWNGNVIDYMHFSYLGK